MAPVATPNRLDNLRTLRNANIDMAFALAFVTLSSGAFLVRFIKMLGGSDFWIGLVSAIPSIMGILQIPGAIVGRRFDGYKRFVTPGGLGWRLAHLPLIALPLLPLAGDVRLTILAICVATAWAMSVFVNPIYNDWLAEMIPPNSRGAFFSRRNAIGIGVGAVVGVVGAAILDAFRRAGQEPLGYTTVFAIGWICAAISAYFYLKMRDLPRAAPSRQTVKEGITELAVPFRNPDFRRVLTALVFLFLGQTFAGNLFVAYGLETLKLDLIWIQGMVFTFAIGNVIASRLWGFLADKYGNKPVLILATAAMCLNPIPWMVARPGEPVFNVIVLLSSHVLMGAIWSGVSLGQFNILLVTAPAESRATYLGAGLSIQAITSGIAPLLGAFMLTELRPLMTAEHAYKWVFGAVIVLRLLTLVLLSRVREEGASGIGTTIRHLRRISPRGVRAMRDIANNPDVAQRETAIQQVATQSLTMAADEIVKALHDPMPRVRRQAALALARLHDPASVEALIHQIEEHPDLLEEETIEALGELGDERAVPSLMRILASPRSMIRRAAARALGRIAAMHGSTDGEVTQALVRAASVTDDPDLRRAALQGLRTASVREIPNRREAMVAVGDALYDPHPSVRIAAAEAVADLELRECLPYVRQSLDYYSDEASAEVAYALGAVGEASDVPRILGVAAMSVSMITRRRCLLGVARVYGVEREVYRLMLAEGMELDGALLALMASGKSKRRAETAMNHYAAGDEAAAVATLAKVIGHAELCDPPVAEAFLVAAALYGR